MSSQQNASLHIAGAWDIYPPGGLGYTFRKAAKQALFFVYLYCGWVQVRDFILGMMGRSRVVILYYHRVGWADVLSKPTRAFRDDMQYLARRYECLTLRELVDRLNSGVPITRKIAVVTFDDGYGDNYSMAFPELLRAGIPATFFVATGFIGTERSFVHDRRALARGAAARDDWAKMSWDDLREMQNAGMEIGSHTVDHVNMGQSEEATIRGQALESLAALKRELGPGKRGFCYPWGGPWDTSEIAGKVLGESGYYAAVTTMPGTVRRNDDLLKLRRVDVGNGHFTRVATRAAIEGCGCGWLARLLLR